MAAWAKFASRLTRRLRVERPIADDSFDGAGSGSWQLVDEVWAEVQDMLPSRADRLPEGFTVTARPSRIRIRYREDITADMRFVLDGRIMEIAAGPVELGRREGMEFLAREYRPAGNPA